MFYWVKNHIGALRANASAKKVAEATYRQSQALWAEARKQREYVDSHHWDQDARNRMESTTSVAIMLQDLAKHLYRLEKMEYPEK